MHQTLTKRRTDKSHERAIDILMHGGSRLHSPARDDQSLHPTTALCSRPSKSGVRNGQFLRLAVEKLCRAKATI